MNISCQHMTRPIIQMEEVMDYGPKTLAKFG